MGNRMPGNFTPHCADGFSYSPRSERVPSTLGWLALVLGLHLSTPSAEAVNPHGPLSDLLVDASIGELGTGAAASLLARLNRYDLSRYSLNFSGGDRISLQGDPAKLDAAILAEGSKNRDLLNLTGPSGSLLFDSDDVRCYQKGKRYEPDLSQAPVSSAESCLGVANARIAAGKHLAFIARASGQSVASVAQQLVSAANANSVSTALTASRASTIDLLISRPSGQFMIDLRRLVSSRWSYVLGRSGLGGGAGAGDSSDRWGFYLNSGGNFGDINTSHRSLGFRINSQFATGGFDYRFSDRFFAGFLFNFTGNQNRLAQNTGSLDADIYRFMPFVSIVPFENAYIDVMVGYAYQRYQLDRIAPGTLASADYSADQALASINLGYTHSIRAFDITGYAGGSYVGTNVGGYGEQGAGTLLRVAQFEVSSWTSTVGMQLAYSHSLSLGVLKPNLRMEWIHEFSGEQPGIQVNVPIQGVVVHMTRPRNVQDWGKLAVGVQALLPRGITGYLSYEAQMMSIGENHAVEGGIRYEF